MAETATVSGFCRSRIARQDLDMRAGNGSSGAQRGRGDEQQSGDGSEQQPLRATGAVPMLMLMVVLGRRCAAPDIAHDRHQCQQNIERRR